MVRENGEGRKVRRVLHDHDIALVDERPPDQIQHLLRTRRQQHFIEPDHAAQPLLLPFRDELPQPGVSFRRPVLEDLAPLRSEKRFVYEELLDRKDLRCGHTSRKGDHPRLADDIEDLTDR